MTGHVNFEASKVGAGVSPETTSGIGTSAALEMLSAFCTVGATSFDVTIKELQPIEGQGEIRAFRRGQEALPFLKSIPALIEKTARDRHNLIVRPRGDREHTFVQLDDLAPDAVERVRPLAFLIIETSPGNFQAWLSVEDADPETGRRLKAATGADAHASGAVRVCGSRNFKEIYAPHFPIIQLVEAAPGRTTTKEELTHAGLLTAEEPQTEAPPARAPRRGFGSSTWPDYGIELARAPQKNDGTGIDVSRADWTFALIAADRGFSAAEITARLLEVSEKVMRMNAKEATAYARRTAERAAESVARRKGSQ